MVGPQGSVVPDDVADSMIDEGTDEGRWRAVLRSDEAVRHALPFGPYSGPITLPLKP
jgi:hypothetical protein